MNRKGSISRRIAFDGLMIATAMILSILDNMIPIQLLVPLPGIKLGLANIVSLVVLYRVGIADTLLVVTLRCVIMIALTGPTVFLFSLAGGLLAVLAMALVRLGTPAVFSLTSIAARPLIDHLPDFGQRKASI